MISFRSDAGAAPRHRLRLVLAGSLAAAVLLLAGCGDRPKNKDAVSQTAARVNNDEITIHQINFRLSQQRALPPEQAASATRGVLERLIDQDLALQKAAEQKLDREPRVMQQIEASRRDIIAQAYLAKISSGAPKPTTQEVKAYYESHPALFKERRVYSLQELDIQAKPEQIATLKSQLQSAKNLPEFISFLKSGNYKFRGGEAVRAAEQLPMSSVAAFAKMKDGQTIFNAAPGGAQVILLAGSRSQPVSEEQATPAIEQYLLNERKRKLVEDDMKALRAAAKIEYLGEFAKDAPKPAPSEPEKPFDSALTTVAPPSSAPIAAPQVDVPLAPVTAASMPSGAILERGLKGMK